MNGLWGNENAQDCGRIQTSGMLSITCNVTHRTHQTPNMCYDAEAKHLPSETQWKSVPEFLLLYSPNGLNKSSRINHIVFINDCERNNLNHILNIYRRNPTSPWPSISRSLHMYSKKQLQDLYASRKISNIGSHFILHSSSIFCLAAQQINKVNKNIYRHIKRLVRASWH